VLKINYSHTATSVCQDNKGFKGQTLCWQAVCFIHDTVLCISVLQSVAHASQTHTQAAVNQPPELNMTPSPRPSPGISAIALLAVNP
jgi:hypothetical protein